MKKIRVYFVGKNPKNTKKICLREICSDDLGATWTYGLLGSADEGRGKSYAVMPGSGINAVVLPAPENKYELRVYFTYDDQESLAVAWMPDDNDHKGDWNLAPNLYSVNKPW